MSWRGVEYKGQTQHNKGSLQQDIFLNKEKLKSVPLKSGLRKVYPVFSYLFNTVLQALARVTRRLKEIKGIQ